MLQFSPDSNYLAATHNGGSPDEIWDLRKGATRPLPPDLKIKGFSPDGLVVVYKEQTGTLMLYDPATLESVRELAPGFKGVVRTAAFAPEGKLMAVTTLAFVPEEKRVNDVVSLLRLPGGEEMGKQRGYPYCLAFSSGGQFLVYPLAENRRSIRVWDVGAEKERAVLRSQGKEGIVSLVFAPNSKTLAAAAPGEPVHVWDVDEGRRLHELRCEGATGCVAWSADGQMLAAGTGGGLVHVWDAKEGKEVIVLRGHTKNAKNRPVVTLTFSPDGRSLVSASRNEVRVWDVAKLKADAP